MAEEEKYRMGFYAGANYGLDPNYGQDFLDVGYRFPVSQFGFPTDPTTANQLDAVSKKLNTGAKTIEVSGLNIMGGGPGALMEKIPEQHLEEIHRLKKLAGVELTFHGPLIEPTGAKQGWEETDRVQAERQMWLAVQRAHKLEPEGNLVVTFHSSSGLPEPETKIFNEKTKKEEIKDIWVVNESIGRFEPLRFEPSYFKGEEGQYDTIEKQIGAMNNLIKKQNEDAWFRQLQGISFHARNGERIVKEVLSGGLIRDEKLRAEFTKDPKVALDFYEKYVKGKEMPKIVEKAGGEFKETAETIVSELTHGDTYLRDAYQNLQNLFNQAYAVAKKSNAKDDLEKLDEYRDEIKKKLSYIENPSKLPEFAETIVKGVNVLHSIEPPKALQPLRDFAIDKSSETFSNIALNAYREFKDSAPIISIENPPVGGGLSRAEDLRVLVEETRDKLVRKLIDEQHLSEGKAREVAEKLVGVTWDVGHINMIRKYGYSKEDVVKETETVAPFVKHVHLSDNFGMEHTELPMGMGNVPIKPMLDAIHQYNEKVKKIVETGDWFSKQGGLAISYTPVRETLRAFGSPVYSMDMAPYWNQAAHATGSYFAGYGQTLPEQHFSLYGAGFSNLPTELGGQMAGRSRMSGAPVD